MTTEEEKILTEANDRLRTEGRALFEALREANRWRALWRGTAVGIFVILFVGSVLVSRATYEIGRHSGASDVLEVCSGPPVVSACKAACVDEITPVRNEAIRCPHPDQKMLVIPATFGDNARALCHCERKN